MVADGEVWRSIIKGSSVPIHAALEGDCKGEPCSEAGGILGNAVLSASHIMSTNLRGEERRLTRFTRLGGINRRRWGKFGSHAECGGQCKYPPIPPYAAVARLHDDFEGFLFIGNAAFPLQQSSTLSIRPKKVCDV